MLTPSTNPSRKEGQQSTCRPADDYSALALGIQFPLTGNVTLRQILVYANLSKSSAYQYGIVPKYDSDEILIDNGKSPPFPWVLLPPPVIKTGKKRWDAVDIVEWRHFIRTRSRKATHSSASDHQAQRKVTP